MIEDARVKDLEQGNSMRNCNGTLMWKVENFSSLIEDARLGRSEVRLIVKYIRGVYNTSSM